MASITFDAAAIFPVGTSVSAYPFDGHAEGLPSGAALDTDVVPSSGMLTFDNLAFNGLYWAIGTVGGTLKRLLIYAPAPPPTNLDALNTELFAHEQDTQGVHGILDTSLLADAADLGGKVDTSQVGVAGGLATLDGSGHLTGSQAASAGTAYKGIWDASVSPHGNPAIVDGTGTAGDFYFVSVAGTRDLGSGNITFAVNDRVIYDGTTAKWQRVAATSPVTSVNTLTGAVVLGKSNVGLGNVDNTSDANKLASTDVTNKLALKQPLDPDLTLIAGLTAAANQYLLATGPGAYTWQTISLIGQLLAGQPDAPSMRLTMGAAATALSINPQTANYTLVMGDRLDTVIEMNLGTPLTVTIPTNGSVAFPIGTEIEVFRRGVGTVTIAGAGGVTLRAPQGVTTIGDQYGTVGLRKSGTNEWVLSGDLG